MPIARVLTLMFLQLIINVFVARLLILVREDASRIGLLCEGTTNIVSVAAWSPPPSMSAVPTRLTRRLRKRVIES